jgi:environmental stress-induced protein Ves
MSETEVGDLISLLGRALREPGLPVIHILLTSHSEAHIREAIQDENVHPLVCEIPGEISGEGVAAIISLDSADVDDDIYIFLEDSFRKLRRRYSNFPQPTSHELAQLASRAGRRFIVASTMMKFIDDGYYDPRDRLHLMLEFTNELLPGTEIYKLYDRILATCTNPARAYLHLSVVASLTNPLSISQISQLLGPGEGRDVETSLVQLRSVVDIPAESSLPVKIFHSSVCDYISDPSNCSLPEVRPITPPHSLLADSSLRLMMRDIPSTALLNAFSKLNRQSQATQSHDSDPQTLTRSLSFIVQPPEPLQILKGLLWVQGYRSFYLRSWLETLDGHEWLHAQCVYNWVHSQGRKDWLRTQEGMDWLQTQGGGDWLQTRGEQFWLKTRGGQLWLQTQGGQDWLQTYSGHFWLRTTCGQDWLRTRRADHWLQTQGGRNWLQTRAGQDWLHTQSGRWWLQAQQQDWLQTQGGQDWLESQEGRDWLDEN